MRSAASPAQEWIERQKEPIDGLNVIAVFVFAIAAMESVPRNVMADPLFALELFVLVIIVTLRADRAECARVPAGGPAIAAWRSACSPPSAISAW